MIQYAGAMRWSYSARAWFGVFAILPDGGLHLWRELTWLNVSPEVAAHEIVKMQNEWGKKLSYVVCNAEMFPKANEVGETVSESFRRAGVPLVKGTEDRVAAFSRLRSWLAKTDPVVAFTVNPECRYWLRTLPTLISAKTDPDDVEATTDEYAAVATAIFTMSRPMPSVAPRRQPYGPTTWGHALRDGHEYARKLGYRR